MDDEMKDREAVASHLRQLADNVEAGKVVWVWLSVKAKKYSYKYSTKGAPARPAGF